MPPPPGCRVRFLGNGGGLQDSELRRIYKSLISEALRKATLAAETSIEPLKAEQTELLLAFERERQEYSRRLPTGEELVHALQSRLDAPQCWDCEGFMQMFALRENRHPSEVGDDQRKTNVPAVILCCRL